MKRNLLLLAFATLVSLLALEAGIGAGAKLGLFPIKIPTYSLQQARSPVFWRDVNPGFGAWHNPNSINRHVKSCFDVTYRSNSYGARDAERERQSERPRIVVLGDSLIEGFGVSAEHRLTDVLERETGIEHLNFGMNANFGTIQYYLLYKTLASGFSHTAVMIGMLPTNDFWDNDIEFGKKVYANRYRPYLVGEYPNYRLVHYQPTLEQSTYRDRGGWPGLGQRLMAEFTYSYNAFAYFKLLLMVRSNPDYARSMRPQLNEEVPLTHPFDPTQPYSGYYDFRKDQLDLAKYTFEQIEKLAGGREVAIVLLPTQSDFQRYDPASPTTPLAADLGKFAKANNMILVDLLPDMYRHAKDWKDYVLPCDGHWNALGHAVAAQFLRAPLERWYRVPQR